MRGISRLIAARSALACTVVVLFFSIRASGAPMLDQSYTSTINLSANIGEGFAYVGQSATAGMSGKLAAVDFYVERRDSYLGQFTFDIRTTNASGLATSVALASVILNSTDVPGISAPGTNFTHVEFPNPPVLVLGQTFAMVISPLPAVQGAGLSKGNWDGKTGDNYLGGKPMFSNDGVSFSNTGSTYDLFFKTYMEIPEPACATTCALMLAFAAARRRRR